MARSWQCNGWVSRIMTGGYPAYIILEVNITFCAFQYSLLTGIFRLGVSLRSHDAFHIARPSVTAGHQGHGGVSQTLRQRCFLDQILETIVLQPLQERFVGLLQLLEFLFRFFRLLDVEALFGDVLEFLAFEFWQTLYAVLVNRFGKVQHFIALSQQPFYKWRLLNLVKEIRSGFVGKRVVSNVSESNYVKCIQL